MTTREIEEGVRAMAWPSPSDGLRERVFAAALRAAQAPEVRQAHPIPTSDPRALRRPAWRTAPVLFVVAALVVIGACTGLDIWAARDLDVEIARLQAKYGSLDGSTLKVPAVPDVDNRARVVRAALEFTVPIAGRQFHYIKFPVPSPVPADLRAFAENNREAIRQVGNIRTRRQSNWEVEVDYEKGSYPPWNSLSLLSDAIFVTCLLDLESGRPDDAAGVIVSGLGIAASLKQEPDGFAQRVRIYNVVPRQLEATRRLISTSTPSATALKELAWWLAENRAPDSMQRALLAELMGTNAMFARMERGDIDPGTVQYIYPMTWPEWPSVFVRPAAQIGRPFVRMARVRSLRRFDEMLNELTGPRPRSRSKEPPPPQRWALVDRLVDKFTGNIWDYGPLGDDFASTLAVAEVGVALRRFKLERFDYPNDLSALVPAYLDRLPIDPYTGRPPVYARQGSGFTLQAKGSTPGLSKYSALEWDVKR